MRTLRAVVPLRWLSSQTLVTADPEGGAPLLLLGADGFGRDLFSRLLHAARVTLALAIVSTLGATLLGTLLGGLAGYAGGRLDALLMRSSEFILVLPAIYVVLALRAALPLVVPPSVTFVALAGIFTLFGWPIVARGVRAIVLSEGQREYVQAARAMGAGPGRILAVHVLPAALGHVASQATLLMPSFILAEATLSYLGLGFPDTHAYVGHLAAGCRERGADRRCAVDACARRGHFHRRRGREPPASRPRSGPCTMSRHVPPPLQSPRRPFAGIHTPIATPFQADGTVDEIALRRNVARWMQSPLTGLVVLGSNGEAPQLDDAEADRVIAIAREGVPRDRSFIVGTGRESTRATIQAGHRAAHAGADAVLVRTPAFFKAQMTAEVLDRHYREVADASPVPVLLYNVTMFTGVTLPVDSVARLAEHPNIVGMKESGSDIGYIADCVTRTPDDFTMLAGSATTFFHALCAGCDGGVLALASLFPADLVRMRDWVQAGKLDEARELQRRLTPIARSIGGIYGVAGLKAALDLLGYAGGPPRPPLRPASPAVIDIIRTQLEALGALSLVSSTPLSRH